MTLRGQQTNDGDATAAATAGANLINQHSASIEQSEVCNRVPRA